MRTIVLAVLLSIILTGFASSPVDPYPGSGGLFLGTPSKEDVDSGRAIYKAERFAQFKVGTTSKSEVVAALGKPAGWSTNADGTSVLEYDYVEQESLMGMQRVRQIMIKFDKKMVLAKLDLPKSGS